MEGLQEAYYQSFSSECVASNENKRRSKELIKKNQKVNV
jgi:hypothetical protein